MKTKVTFWLTIAVCFMLVFPSISGATPILEVTDGSTTVFGVDSGGVMTVTGESLGRFTVDSITGVYSPDGLYLSGHIYSWGGPTSLTITFSDNSYIGTGASIPVDIALDFFTSNDGQADYKAYRDLSLLHEFTSTGAVEVFDNPSGPFSLEQSINLDGGNTEYWLDASLGATPAPEPSSLILLGSGLIGAFMFSRRKS